MSIDERSTEHDLDGFRPVIPANRYYLNHMLDRVERCIDAIDEWLLERRRRRGGVVASIAQGERTALSEFDLPEVSLPTSVLAFLPSEEANDVVLPTIYEAVETARSKCESIESLQELHSFIHETEDQIEHLVRVYARPYERLRLEIWTRLQQLDLFDLRRGEMVPKDLVELPNALTIEQMIEQWLSDDPVSRIAAFTVRGPLGLSLNLIERTVTRQGMSKEVSFASKTTMWLPFIIAFFAGRNGADKRKADRLCESMLERHSARPVKDASTNRNKYIRDANRELEELHVEIDTDWSLKSLGSYQ